MGPVRQQTDWMVELLSDPALTALHVVTSPEEMPVNETIELVERARAEVNVPLRSVVVNRVLPEPFTRADEPVFERSLPGRGPGCFVAAAGPGTDAALDATCLAVACAGRGRCTWRTCARRSTCRWSISRTCSSVTTGCG